MMPDPWPWPEGQDGIGRICKRRIMSVDEVAKEYGMPDLKTKDPAGFNPAWYAEDDDEEKRALKRECYLKYRHGGPSKRGGALDGGAAIVAGFVGLGVLAFGATIIGFSILIVLRWAGYG